jgi:hypothetical protein
MNKFSFVHNAEDCPMLSWSACDCYSAWYTCSLAIRGWSAAQQYYWLHCHVNACGFRTQHCLFSMDPAPPIQHSYSVGIMHIIISARCVRWESGVTMLRKWCGKRRCCGESDAASGCAPERAAAKKLRGPAEMIRRTCSRMWCSGGWSM